MKKLKSSLAKVVRSSVFLSCIYYTFTDLYIRVRFRMGNIKTDSGTIHYSLSLQASLDYIYEVFKDYKQYSGITSFYGRVAEVGPGDNCGVGLLFLADGCSSIDLVDRFYSHRNPEAHAKIYRVLLESHGSLTGFIGQADLNNEKTFSGINRYYGPEAAAENFFSNNHKGYDFIISRAVFEHCYDPLTALKKMAEALNPGGMLLHKVDLRDHGLFSRQFHELKFLEVPDWLYFMMTSASGRPNRVLVHRYKQCIAKLNLDAQFLVTRLAGVGDINPHRIYSEIPLNLRQHAIKYIKSIRHRFVASFHNVSDEDLSIAGIFIVARKPNSKITECVA